MWWTYSTPLPGGYRYYLYSKRPSWLWLYVSWIYNYICNKCLSPLTVWVFIPLRRGVLYTTLYDKVCQCPAAGSWYSPGTPVSITNKTDRHDITEILLKVALRTINKTNQPTSNSSPMTVMDIFNSPSPSGVDKSMVIVIIHYLMFH
jgi:hypothetical protein